MNAPAPITYYLDRFSAGDVDGAFFGLLELNHSLVNDLIGAYSREEDRQRRVFLLKVISEHRQPSCLGFLIARLEDEDPRIWREALDGLALIASPAVLEALRAAKGRFTPARLERHRFGVWCDEALSQMSEHIAS